MLIDQAAQNYSIPAWLVRIGAGGNAVAETILIIDGQSGAVLYKEDQISNLMDRTVWSGVDYQKSFSLATSSRYENGPVSSVSEIENVFGWMGVWYSTFTKYNRDGADGKGMPMLSFINWPSSSQCPTAFFVNTLTENSKPVQTSVMCTGLIASDVVYHEATHGLVWQTANLNGTTIGSGLNEGFADAFADLIGNKWIIGQGMVDKTGDIPRYASKPSLDGHSIDSWAQYTGSIPDVHSLAGLVTHPAYLLTNGGAGAGSDIVNARGYELTKDLYYATLLRLTSNSTFLDFGKMLVAQAKAGFSYGPKSTACDALMAVRSVGLDAGIATDVCTDKRKMVSVLMTD